ncbi:hypothetical protein K7640_04495 [Micromonospora sp. PLK6-60]|uniref:hypothetical protein n=1 Tax=Micromonospora sp. PLK6-60 TaxID=2873383 RepID=UPI001CA6C040|nr:hypothetical protein [Micromonospora sp. PLK6-60]MBY8871103.1 hypothetical protein [Micromonospora sp. PLK6-60]
MSDARARRARALDRSPVLLLFGALWAPMTVLVALPMRWLFDRAEPLDQALVGAAFNLAWLGPAMWLSRRLTEGHHQSRDQDGTALRRALRDGEPPAGAGARAELPAFLRRQRRGTLLGLALILAYCVGLSLFAVLTLPAVGGWWPMVFGVVAGLAAATAALTLTRVRRLAGRPAVTAPGAETNAAAAPGQRG